MALLLVQVASMQHWFGWHGAPGPAAAPTSPGAGPSSMSRPTAARGARRRWATSPARSTGWGRRRRGWRRSCCTQDAAGLRVDPRIARLAGTPEEIRRVEAGHGDPDAPPGTGLFVVRRPNGAFAATIDGAADARAIAGRLRDLIG